MGCVCVCVCGHYFQQIGHQSGMDDIPARGQLNSANDHLSRGNSVLLTFSPCVPENLV